MNSVVFRSVRFGAAALIGAAIHVAVASALIVHVSAIPAFANGVAFAVAATACCLINSIGGIREDLIADMLQRFVIVGCFGFTAAAMLASLAEFMGWDYGWGIALAILGASPLNFLLVRTSEPKSMSHA